MQVHGLPETFWIVMKPSPLSEMCDICFPCTFEGLMQRARGGLNEGEIVGVYADEGEARKQAAMLLGDFPVRPQDAMVVEAVIHVMVIPNMETPARELARAAIEAVRNAVRRAGHEHRLKGRATLGVSDVVDLHDQLAIEGS